MVPFGLKANRMRKQFDLQQFWWRFTNHQNMKMYRKCWRGNQKSFIEEQTMQWPKKWQKDKQWSTKHYTDNQDWITEKTLKTGVQGLAISVPLVIPIMTLVTNSVISHEWEKVKIVAMTNKYIHGHQWHINSLNINQVMTVTVKLSKWWLQLNRWFCSFLVITEILIGTTSSGIMYQKWYPF